MLYVPEEHDLDSPFCHFLDLFLRVDRPTPDHLDDLVHITRCKHPFDYAERGDGFGVSASVEQHHVTWLNLIGRMQSNNMLKKLLKYMI